MNTLEHTHRLKAAYQGNMLKALAITIFIMLMLLAILLLFATPTVPTTRYSVVRLDKNIVPSQHIPPPNSTFAFSQAESNFSGGWIDSYHINTDHIPEINLANGQKGMTSEILNMEEGFNPVASLSNEATGTGMFYTDEPDPFGLGSDQITWRTYPLSIPDEPTPDEPDHIYDASEHVLTDLGEFSLAPIYFPIEAKKNDTGLVIVDILIDKDGYIEWEFKSVSPKGKGFKRVVERALINGKYSAAKINGRGVARRFTANFLVIHGHESFVTERTKMEEFKTGFLPK